MTCLDASVIFALRTYSFCFYRSFNLSCFLSNFYPMQLSCCTTAQSRQATILVRPMKFGPKFLLISFLFLFFFFSFLLVSGNWG